MREMNTTVNSMRPGSMGEHERIRLEIEALRIKVRSFETELIEIKRIFNSGTHLDEPRLHELKNRRRALGALKEKHQERIRGLKKRRQSRKES
jgi:hypothetical protein